MNQDIIFYLVCAGISGVIAIIAFFLKRTMKDIDSLADKVIELQKNSVSDNDLKEVTNSISALSDKFATKEEVKEVKESLKKITSDIDFIKEKTVRNDDFIRAIARIESLITNIK